jgi:hypothetical protein
LKHLSGAPLWGRFLALPTNNRLGWKDLPGVKTLAFCKNSKLTDVNFYNIGPRLSVDNTFSVPLDDKNLLAAIL